MELKDTHLLVITPSFNNSIVQFLLLLALLRNSDWTFKHLIIFFSDKVVLYDLLPINSYIFGPLSHPYFLSSTKYPTCGRTGEPFLKSDIRVNHEQKNTLLYEEIKK